MDTDKHGFDVTNEPHLPHEAALLPKPFISVSIRVHPWLNCGFWIHSCRDGFDNVAGNGMTLKCPI
jgi:hypothetical protein